MKRGIRIVTLLIQVGAIAMASSPHAHGQGGRPADNVLFPHPLPIPRMMVGVDGGWGYWINSGRFGVTDATLPCVQFTDGNGNGPAVGARLLYYLNHTFFLSPRIRYELRAGNFITPLAGEPVRDQGNNVVMLEQEAEARGRFGVASFDCMVGYHPFDAQLYLAGGGSGGVVVSATYDYTERIISPAGFVYADTRATTHTPAPNRTFENATTVAFSVRGGIGYLHTIGRFTLNPEIFYSRSLTPLLEEPDAMDQQGIVALIGLLWEL